VTKHRTDQINQTERENENKRKKEKKKGWEYFEDEHLFNVRHRLLLLLFYE
jgi:hypothetical protein